MRAISMRQYGWQTIRLVMAARRLRRYRCGARSFARQVVGDVVVAQDVVVVPQGLRAVGSSAADIGSV